MNNPSFEAISSIQIPESNRFPKQSIKNALSKLQNYGVMSLITFYTIISSCSKASAATYYWVGGSSNTFGTLSNWNLFLGGGSSSPASISSSDIFIVDGSDISSTSGTQTGTVSIDMGSSSFSVGQFKLINNSTVILTGTTLTRTLTVGGAISGDDFVIQSGSSLTLSTNANLSMAASSTIDISGTLTINTSRTLVTTGKCTVSGTLICLGAINSAGTSGGELALNGTFNQNTTTTIYFGSLSGSGSLTSTASGDRIFQCGADNSSTIFSGTITNGSATTFNVVKMGNGVLTLNNTGNNWNGYTIINGTIKLGFSGVIPDGTALTVNGTLDLNGNSETVGSIASNGTIDGTLGTPTLTCGGDNTSTPFSGVIKNTAGTLSLVKTGSGTLTLSGANTYSGSTTISSGTIKLGATGVIPDASAVTVTGTLDMGAFSETVGSITGGGTIDNSAGVSSYTLTCGGGNTSTTFSGVIKNSSGNVSLIKTGTGTLTLTGTNTYTGTTTLTGGTLILGASDAISNSSNFVMNGGTFSSGSISGYSETIGTLTLSNNSTINLGSGSHIISFSASNAAGWTANKILTITGWQGTVTSSGSTGTAGILKFGTTSSGLTSSQLLQIVFNIGGNLYPAAILSNGEIVPVSSRTFYSAAAGNWAVSTNWAVGSHAGTTAYDYPRAGDIVYIQHAMTFNANAACATIYIDAGTSSITALTINAPYALDVSGTIRLTSDECATKDVTITGSGTINCANIEVGNNITSGSTGTSNLTMILKSSVTTLNCTGTMTIYANNVGSYKLNTEFDLLSGTLSLGYLVVTTEALNNLDAKFTNVGSGTLQFTGSGTVVTKSGGQGATTATETIIFTGSSVEYIGNSNQTIYATSYKGLRIANSGGTATLGGDIYIAGDWDNDGAFSSSTYNVTFNGAASQSILGNNTTTFNIIYVNNPGYTVSLVRNVLATELNYKNTSGTATFSISSGVTLNITGALKKTTSNSTTDAVLSGLGTLNCASIAIGTSGTVSTASVNATNNFTSTISLLNCSGDMTILTSCYSSYKLNHYCYLNSGTIQVANILLTDVSGGCSSPIAQLLNTTSPQNATLKISGANGITSSGGGAYTVTLNGSSSIIEFNGSSAQNTGTAFPGTSSDIDLVINNSQDIDATSTGVTLTNSLTFPSSGSPSLTLTKGILTTGSNTMKISSTSTLSGGSSSSYVNGYLVIDRGSGSLSNPTYHIGKGGRYLPVQFTSITHTSGSTIGLEAFNANCAGSIASNGFCYLSSTEYWKMTFVANAPSNISAIFTRNTALNDLSIISSTTLSSSYDPAGSYLSLGAAAGYPTSYSIKNSTTFSGGTPSPRYMSFAFGSTIPKGGTAAATSTSVCSGSNTTITVSGYGGQSSTTGATIQWQESDDNGVSDAWGNVVGGSGATSATYTTANLTNTKYYRAAITGGPSGCVGTSYSTLTSVSVVAPNTAGSASSSPTLCLNTALTGITHTTTEATGIGSATGLPAGVTAAWASNTITISGTPTESGTFSYSIPLTGGCGSVNAIGTITVSSPSVGGTISGGSVSVCTASNSTTLNLSGNTGNVTKWQSSTTSDFSTSVTDILNTSTSLTATNLTQTTYYRAVVTSGVCSSANSLGVTLTVNTPSIPFSITGSQYYIWNGSISTSYSTASNWYYWDGSSYSIASTEPGTNSKIIIPSGTCVSNTNSPQIKGISTSGPISVLNGGILTISNAFDVYGDVIIKDGGGIVFQNDGVLEIHDGHLTFEGTTSYLTPASGSIKFHTTTAAQHGHTLTCNSNSNNFYNLEFHGDASTLVYDFSLESDINVSNEIKVVTNNVDLNNHRVNLGSTGYITEGTNGKKFFDLGTGYFESTRTIGDGQTVNAGNLGLTIQAASGKQLGTTVVKRYHKSISNDLDGLFNAAVSRYYNVSPQYNGGTGNTYSDGLGATVTFNYSTVDIDSSIDESHLAMYRKGLGEDTWQKLDYGTLSMNNKTYTYTNFPKFSDVTLGGGGTPLPVDLLSFSGNCEESKVSLQWKTASERNSEYFDVERSRDGENWQVLITVPAAGNSNQTMTYNAMDNNAGIDNNYYRLKQVDIDGVEKQYNVINVGCKPIENRFFSSYPNPSGNSFQLVINDKELLGRSILNIYDSRGAVAMQREIDIQEGINMYVINEHLAPGVYMIHITNGGKSSEVLRHSIK